ncbi:hypothetical protein ACKKBG_A23875 [Auxenochlorella protothecoides x Auxenochlorella symbiontica]
MQALHSRPFVSGGALHSSRRGVSRPNRSTVCRVDAVARRSLTLQEQLKSVRAAFEERQQAIADRIGQTKLAAMVMHASDKLAPYLRALDLERRRLVQDYFRFVEEDKRLAWHWECQNVPEAAFWAQQPANIIFFVMALLYQGMLPVSFLLCGVIPFYFAWIMWDRWWASPVGLALLLTWPMKFPPWVFWSTHFAWVWPGLV